MILNIYFVQSKDDKRNGIDIQVEANWDLWVSFEGLLWKEYNLFL